MELKIKELQRERIILEKLIKSYGNINLLDAHDRVSVEIDFYRGDCVKKRNKNFKRGIRKKQISKRVTLGT